MMGWIHDVEFYYKDIVYIVWFLFGNYIKVFEWCPIADSKTLSQTQMVSNTQN